MFLKLPARFPLLLSIIILTGSHVLSQTTSLSFTSIPISDPDLNAPGRGVEQWHDQNLVNVPVEGVNTQRLDVYHRFVWTRIEGPTMGSYNWQYFDSLVNNAITKKQKLSFGIMPLYPGGSTQHGLVSYDGGLASYPLYLHNLMQGEAVKDWRTGTVWTPNYNSTHYQNRLLALHQAIDAHIKSTSFNGVLYKNVISCIDIRGYGAWGEWHSGYTPKNVVSDYPAGTFPTIATLKKIVDAHTQGFPDFPLVAMIAAFDANYLQNTMNPPEIAHYVLTQRNNWGLIGWRRDQWGATDTYLSAYLENNTRSFGGLVFRDSIMARWRTAPITGEPPGWNPNSFADLERQIRLYHATSFGNGNYGGTPTSTVKSRVRASSKASGYRLIIEGGSMTSACRDISITLNWKNTGQAPNYENWNVFFELKNSSNSIAWSGPSQFKPRFFLPATNASPITDNFALPANLPTGTYSLNLIIKDANGYRDPLPLAINGRNADGSYTISQITIPSAPGISVVNNCGSSVLTATGYSGTLLWSTGATTHSITVTEAGTYSVTQSTNGCTSPAASATAAPGVSNVPAPSVTVANDCGTSILTATGAPGATFLWSTGATGGSISVTSAGTYTVTQTVNGCTSPAGSGIASPTGSGIAAPAVSVVNDCGNSVLTATGSPTATLLWSTGATSSSITVTTAGTYTVTQTENGCTSPTASRVAAPKAIPVLSSNLSANATSGSAFAYTPTSSTTGTSFAWSRAAVTGISNTAGSGTGSINETLINTTTSPVNVTYVYTLTANGCTNNLNLVVTVHPVTQVNCVINGSIASNFNSSAIPAGRFIWFSSVIDQGSTSGISGTITFTITNSRITFTANNQQYTLIVPNSVIRYDAAVTNATTQFVNSSWETAVPRNYKGNVFMGGLKFAVPGNLPGSISNVTWTATISINKANIRPTWKWAAAVYTSLADHSGLAIKPRDAKDQNLFSNNDNAGTPENYKTFVVEGAKGNGGSDYTGSYSSTSTATCSTSGQRSAEPAITKQLIVKGVPTLPVALPGDEKLEAIAAPNPSNGSFNIAIKGDGRSRVSVKVMDIFGRVVERHDKVPANWVIRVGQRLAAGSYFVEVNQDGQKKVIRIIKVN